MTVTGLTQGGSNADIVIADAYFKNISEGVNWRLAYEALLSDAEIEPLNWDIEGTGLRLR
ncbi:glycoside hydrolase domain-containing protein [Salmonella enterica]|uniref:glycoside hydrolase domain-containing protein n=1 Tax=Salmonella enterica TaxID=28901 RepID=UPI00398C6C19